MPLTLQAERVPDGPPILPRVHTIIKISVLTLPLGFLLLSGRFHIGVIRLVVACGNNPLSLWRLAGYNRYLMKPRLSCPGEQTGTPIPNEPLPARSRVAVISPSTAHAGPKCQALCWAGGRGEASGPG